MLLFVQYFSIQSSYCKNGGHGHFTLWTLTQGLAAVLCLARCKIGSKWGALFKWNREYLCYSQQWIEKNISSFKILSIHQGHLKHTLGSRSFLLASLFDSETEVVTHKRKRLSWSNTVSNANELFQSFVKQILGLCETHQTTLLVLSKFSLEEWKWNGYNLGILLYISCLDSAHISNAPGLNLLCWSILLWNVTPHDRNYSINIWSIISTQNHSKILMAHSTDWWHWFP